jgi:hypothetical protein
MQDSFTKWISSLWLGHTATSTWTVVKTYRVSSLSCPTLPRTGAVPLGSADSEVTGVCGFRHCAMGRTPKVAPDPGPKIKVPEE